MFNSRSPAIESINHDSNPFTNLNIDKSVLISGKLEGKGLPKFLNTGVVELTAEKASNLSNGVLEVLAKLKR